MSNDRLTYSDVHCILAALDGWPKGQIHLRLDDLDLQAVVVPTPVNEHSPSPLPFEVKAPAVGTFTSTNPVPPGTRVGPETVLGVIASPGREAPVLSEADKQGRMIRYEVPDHSFVEYGQIIALIDLGAAQ